MILKDFLVWWMMGAIIHSIILTYPNWEFQPAEYVAWALLWPICDVIFVLRGAWLLGKRLSSERPDAR